MEVLGREKTNYLSYKLEELPFKDSIDPITEAAYLINNITEIDTWDSRKVHGLRGELSKFVADLYDKGVLEGKGYNNGDKKLNESYINNHIKNTISKILEIDTWDKEKLECICDDLKPCLLNVYQQGVEDGVRYCEIYSEYNGEE